MGVEAADELRVGDEAAPSFAHEAGLVKRGGMRWDAKEDLFEEVVVV